MAGCGSKGLNEPPPKADQTLTITAPWPDGGQIPVKFTCDGTNAKPRIGFTGAAFGDNAPKDFVIVVTDPDASGGTFVHWTSWGNHIDGENSFGKTGYRGPCPPEGDAPHHYVTAVYALRRPLGLARGAGPQEVVDAIRGNVLASGSVTGLYGR